MISRHPAPRIVLALLTAGALGLPTAAAEAPAATNAQPVALVSASPAGTWRVSARAAYRVIHRVLFRTGADRSPARGVSGSRASVGSATSYDDRRYDDGYVRRDAGTGLDGTTWYWGYEDASQVRNGTIVFSAYDGLETVGTDSESVPEAWRKKDMAVPCFGVAAERMLGQTGAADVGLRLECSFLRTSVSEEFQGASLNQYVRRIEDTYDLHGIVPPAAPYGGTYAGPGPLLDNMPSSRRIYRTPAGIQQSQNTIRESVDIDLSTLSLGLLLSYPVGPIDLSASLGPTINLIQTSALRRESDLHSNAVNRSRSRNDDWVFGYYAEGTLGIHLTPRLGLTLSGRYDSLSVVSGPVGPSSFEADTRGWSAEFGVAMDL